jgi:hypothetical protein
MQTLEFVEALKRIVRELKVVELTSLIRPWVVTPNVNVSFDEPLKDSFVRLLFESYAGYQQLTQVADTRRILQEMDVVRFYETGRLRQMTTSVASAPQLASLVQGQQAVYAMIVAFSAQLEAFLKIQATTEKLLEKEKIGQVPANESIVELELIEYSDEEGFSPKRVQILSESVRELHTNLAILYKSESQRIIFKYFDSGSGLLLGIQCAKEIAETISRLFSQWWERIVFFRYDSFDKKVAAANKSLSFAESVEDSIVKGVITKEEGENLKHRVFQQMEKLTGIGVTVPITAAASINQQQLLTEVRNTKLLTDGSSREEKAPAALA